MIQYLIETSVIYFSAETTFLHVLLRFQTIYNAALITTFLVKTVAQIPVDMTFLITQRVAGVQSFWVYFKRCAMGTIVSLHFILELNQTCNTWVQCPEMDLNCYCIT